ncbi:MAG TPA: nitroreductase [Ilumatobacteraceae bacterium]|nr:nitroreductase [Ilumatobacteraceae bacterium]
MTPEGFAALVRARRTNMKVDPHREVPRDVVEYLCELAQWAPNHKRTWPWRFCMVTEGRAEFGDAIADVMAEQGDPVEKVDKTRTKFLRTPCLLVVGADAGDSALRKVENRDAVAAGVQNILLGATAAGLASYWASCPKGADAAVAEMCGFPQDTAIVAIIYLGWQADDVPVPERPPVELHTF